MVKLSHYLLLGLAAMFAAIVSCNWVFVVIGQMMQLLIGCAIKECVLMR